MELTNEKLKELVEKYPPSQEWFEEDFTGLFLEEGDKCSVEGCSEKV